MPAPGGLFGGCSLPLLCGKLPLTPALDDRGESMFCSNCGEKISQGKAFCRYCGTPVGAPPATEAGAVPPGDTDAMSAATVVVPPEGSEAATMVAAPAADEAATMVQSSAGSEAATIVQPPLVEDVTLVGQPAGEEPTLIKGAAAGDSGVLPPVAEARKVVPLPAADAAALAAMVGPAAPAAPPRPPSVPLAPPPPTPPLVGYALATPPPYLAYGRAQPPRKGRGGLIAGIAVAVVIVLAAAGVAAFLLVRDDDSSGSVTTTVQASDTTVAAETTTTVPPASTTSTTVAVSTTTSIAITTTTTLDPVVQYLTATDALVALLTDADARIPVLAQKINASAPHVPQTVDNELQAILDKLDASVTELSALPVPPVFQESHKWLDEAATCMAQAHTGHHSRRATPCETAGSAVPARLSSRGQDRPRQLPGRVPEVPGIRCP